MEKAIVKINDSSTEVNDIRISSRDVAKMMEEPKHSNLMRKIESISKKLKDTSDYWVESSYVDQKGQSRKEYLVTKKGIKLIIDNTRKSPRLNKLIEYLEGEYVLMTRFEESFKYCLEETLSAIDIEIETQKDCDGFRIDFYIPKYNIAIEYDEVHHQYNKDKDEQRESYIKEKLKCKFIRLDYMESDNYNVGLVIKSIMEGK